MDSDEVFKALADSSRRKLLDSLFQQNGQTLTQLHNQLLLMTRFGCMKHLRVLEEAGLVITRKVGREKYHYLNTVPIQLLYERWVSKYAQPWASALTGLKEILEVNTMSEKHSHVFEVYIRTTPEKVWQALTDGAITQHYNMGTQVSSSWEKGAALSYATPNGFQMVAGEILDIEPGRKFVATFRPTWSPDMKDFPVSKVTWQIEQLGTVCKVTLTHDELVADEHTVEGLMTGWAQILSGLKTLLETGEPLVIPAQ